MLSDAFAHLDGQEKDVKKMLACVKTLTLVTMMANALIYSKTTSAFVHLGQTESDAKLHRKDVLETHVRMVDHAKTMAQD